MVDLFERITIFHNRVHQTRFVPMDDGRYKVTLAFETKKLLADADGKEQEVGPFGLLIDRATDDHLKLTTRE